MGGMSACSDTLSRFRKVCGLLGSSHAGERAAAALKATEVLKAAGKTWADVGVGAAGNVNDALTEMFIAKSEALRLQMALDDERARNTRLQREVERLKGMWPKGEPKVAA
jgi:hypothetical protein